MLTGAMPLALAASYALQRVREPNPSPEIVDEFYKVMRKPILRHLSS
jgi:hypothetical protein